MPFKRRASAVGAVAGPPAKRQTRRSAKFQSSPKQHTTSCQPHTSCFDKLPTEIITEIWQLCREPALIHSCRRMYETLPSFVAFAKCVAALAFIAQPCKNYDLDAVFSDMLVPIPGIEKPYDAEARQQMQSEVLTSTWFRARHLPIIFKEIYTRAVRFELNASTYFQGSFSLSTGQERKLGKFLREVDILHEGGSVRLRLRAACAALYPMNIDIRANHMLFSSAQYRTVVIPSSICIRSLMSC